MPSAQLNVRVDQDIKRAGDSTLARLGVSASDAVRALWEYLAQAQELPSFMRAKALDASSAPHAAAAVQAPVGAGMALALAREKGLQVPDTQELDYQQLRDYAFEELVAEGRAHA